MPVRRFRLGAHEVDLNRQVVVGPNGTTQTLTELEAALLGHLADRAGTLVPKPDLLREVWGYAPGVRSRAVDYTVRRLRLKLEPIPKAPVYLLGVYGSGVGLEGMAPLDEPSPTGGSAEPPPVPLDLFVGREDALERLGSWIDDGARIISILGPGGGGKTRLVHEALRRGVLPAVRWVSLGAVDDAAGLGSAIAQALGRMDSDAAAALQGQRGWLVLDEGERCTALLQDALPHWLQGAPNLGVVLTTRERLGIAGELPLWLGPLSARASARLYEARAAAAGALHPPGDAQVTDLVDALEGLPLAIELAAARAGVRTVDDLLATLDRPLDTLADGGRSLRTVLEWSWALLPADDAAVLARCAVFPGRFGREAAEVAAGPAAVAALDRLRNRSLVRAFPGTRRTFLLALGVRALAEERLPAASRYAIEDALAKWAQDRAEGPTGRTWIRDELELLRSLQHRLALRSPAAALALATRIAPTMAERGMAQAALESLSGAPATSAAAVVRGQMLAMLGHREDARLVFDAALESSDPTVLARARLDLAELDMMLGQSTKGEEHLTEALRLCTACGDAPGVATATQRLGLAARLRGDLPRALHRARESLRLWQHLEDPDGVAGARLDYGLLLRNLGKLVEARRELQHALATFEATGNVRRTATVRLNLGVLCASQGDRELAMHHYTASMVLQEKVGNRRAATVLQLNCASIAMFSHQADKAEAHLEAAGTAAAELDDPRLASLTVALRGILRCVQGRQLEALALLQRAVAQLVALGAGPTASWFATYIGVIGALEQVPVAMGVPPACMALVVAAQAVAAGTSATAALSAMAPAELDTEDGRFLAGWLTELSAGLPDPAAPQPA